MGFLYINNKIVYNLLLQIVIFKICHDIFSATETLFTCLNTYSWKKRPVEKRFNGQIESLCILIVIIEHASGSEELELLKCLMVYKPEFPKHR